MSNAELRIGTDRHRAVLQALMARVKLSENALEKVHSRWQANEKEFDFYVPEREVDSVRKAARSGGKPQYTTIEVPYTYAQMMAAHTYLASVFLSRNPILQFGARHGEPEMNVMAVESLMDYQVQVGQMLAPFYIWLHDACKYGIGIIGRYWEEEVHTVSEIREEEVTLMGQPIPGKTRKVKTVNTVTGYQGNRVFNVRPYDYLGDPRVPLREPNKGEFCGRRVPVTWNTVVKRKLSGQYIKENVEWASRRIKSSGGTSDRVASIMSEHDLPEAYWEQASHTQTSLVEPLPAIELVVELIPNEWGLGSTEYPEKWVFTILDEKVIVEARPQGQWHNKFPFEVIETEIEGYALVKRSMLEIGRPLNEVMTWLVNSHFFSVRKTLNGDIIYDPSRIVASDLLNSDGTGSRIRVKPIAYGQDVRSMLHVVQGGADITGTHLRDTEIMGQMLQRVLGISDNILGSVNPGGRKTATEIRTAGSSSVNRLKTIAEYISADGFAPLAQQLLQSTQQNYKAEKKFRIVGDQANNAQQFLDVSPDTIAGFYDFSPVDGTLPLDRFALVNMWGNLFTQVRNFPDIMQQYNFGDIFAWVAQLGGIKNIKQFKVQTLAPGVTPGGIPAGALSGQSAGPAGGQSAARGGNRTTGVGAAGIPLPPQIGGVGNSG